jgi:hypothetical protein
MAGSEKLMIPAGMDALLAGLAAAKVAARPAKRKRSTVLSAAQAAVAVGKFPPLLVFPASAFTYERHGKALLDMAFAGDVAGLKAYPIKGVNTWGKALRGYRDLLLVLLEKRPDVVAFASLASQMPLKPGSASGKVMAKGAVVAAVKAAPAAQRGVL